MNLFSKIQYIVPKEIKLRSFFFLLIVLFTTFADLLSVGIIFPVVNTLVSGDANFLTNITNNIFSNILFIETKFNNRNLVLSSLLLIFFVKFFFMMLFIFYQSDCVSRATRIISLNLIKKYLHNNYTFFLEKNSAELIRNLTSEIAGIIKKIIIPINYLILDIIVFVGIILILFYAHTKASIVIFFSFLILILIYFFFTKKKLYDLGSKNIELEKNKLKTAQESIRGIKLLKLYNKEDEMNKLKKNFILSFKKQSKIFYNDGLKHNLLF